MTCEQPSAAGPATIRLFSDRGCPFAHRVLALLDHLGCDAELTESQVGDRPEGIEAYAETSQIPLLVHGDLVVTESRVMLEHLAEHSHWADAYPRDLGPRTLHRAAMAVVDDFIAPLLTRPFSGRDVERLARALGTIETAIAGTGPAPEAPAPSLLALHIAPIWLRFRWWHPDGPVTRAVQARPKLCQWLDAAAALPCIARTAPDPTTRAEDIARARRAGLLPPAGPGLPTRPPSVDSTAFVTTGEGNQPPRGPA